MDRHGFVSCQCTQIMMALVCWAGVWGKECLFNPKYRCFGSTMPHKRPVAKNHCGMGAGLRQATGAVFGSGLIAAAHSDWVEVYCVWLALWAMKSATIANTIFL